MERTGFLRAIHENGATCVLCHCSPFSVTLCQDIRAWLLVFHGRERWEDEEEEKEGVEEEEEEEEEDE